MGSSHMRIISEEFEVNIQRRINWSCGFLCTIKPGTETEIP